MHIGNGYPGRKLPQNTVGTITLDYVPQSIVYGPPGQDMTNSLTQSIDYGTSFTVSKSSTFTAETGAQGQVGVVGVASFGASVSESTSTGNSSSTKQQVSYFRTTVTTVDNQKAVGRAYWGPLSDTFVIMVNPTFAVGLNPDGKSYTYSLISVDSIVNIPAFLLLRPGTDPIASGIPWYARKNMLTLDPFIMNLDSFLPTDSGADLSLASNPYADPSANNRAELIGIWSLDAGTALNYSSGRSRALMSTETNEVDYSCTVSVDASGTGVVDGITGSLGVSGSYTTSFRYQSSKETDQSTSQTASCFLIHNQNDRNLQGIALYYDRIFSTFMFQQITTYTLRPVPGSGTITGGVFDYRDARLRGLDVSLSGAQIPTTLHTSTRYNGTYSFYNLPAGEYTISAGDKQLQVAVSATSSLRSPTRKDLESVRRVFNIGDIQNVPVWELRDALGLSADAVRALGRRVDEVHDLASLAQVVGASAAQVSEWSKLVELQAGTNLRGPSM